MRTDAEYRAILELWERYIPKKRIGIMLNIPRATVRDCINRYGTVQHYNESLSKKVNNWAVNRLTSLMATPNDLMLKSYAYLLGIYLGDGSISEFPRSHRLRVTLDARYPGIINTCVRAIETVLPDNSVYVQPHQKNGKLSCVNVTVYSTQLVSLFPQHGSGKKHQRAIVLNDWQQDIVDELPIEFFRGLFHSDGSRFDNVVNGKAYPHYQFSNSSEDIIALCTMTCERMGIHFTRKIRRVPNRMDGIDIMISRRADVAFLDQYIGRKC
jgi:hypothetical protein